MEPKTKTGKNTSEFALTVGTALVQIAGAILAAAAAVNGAIPDKWAAGVAIAVVIATAVQAAGYSLSRGQVKAGLRVAELKQGTTYEAAVGATGTDVGVGDTAGTDATV